MPVFGVRQIEGASVNAAGLHLIFPMAPPTWTRLEPQSATGDPAPGLAARIHDPLWLLARQWQFGELTGENAGTPLSITVSGSSRRICVFDPPGGDAASLPPGALLDPIVEREPPNPEGPGYKARAEAGMLLVAMLADAGLDARARLRETYPFNAGLRRDALAENVGILLARSPDGEAIATALDAGKPDWLEAASAAARAAAGEWHDWYRGNVSTLGGSDCWLPRRLEYQFAVRAGGGDGQTVLEAPQHEGGEIDWFAFDASRRRLNVADEPADAPETSILKALVSPLVYAGMPADRLWEFEDGAVSFGAMDVQSNDIARLCLVEFAMVYGCDWFLAPFDIPAGALSSLETVTVVDSFGEPTDIGPADPGPAGRRFRLFSVGEAGGEGAIEGLLVPPTAMVTMEGMPLEQVDFFRDEMANMAWAAERIVQDAAGDPVGRRWDRTFCPVPDMLESAELLYTLASEVPPYWIPLVPVPDGDGGGFILRKGTMTGDDESRGRILAGRRVDIYDEEVPRAGIIISRVPCLTRGPGGRRIRWIARRASAAYGEGSSGLAFDGAAHP